MVAFIFLCVQVVLIAAITWLEQRRGRVASDWLRNLQAWALNMGAGFILMPLIQGWNGATLLDGHALPFLIVFPILLLARDGAEFAFHVAQHKVGFLWKMHSLHHSDPEMSAMTTNRHFWADQVIKGLTVWPLVAVLISVTPAMMWAYAVVSLYNYFIHANLRVNFGRWSWLLNSPAYHRRHHSRLPEHYDSNFAALFPIFDVIFGTYNQPDGWPPSGLDTAPQRFGELVAWPFIKQEPDEAPAEAQTPAQA